MRLRGGVAAVAEVPAAVSGCEMESNGANRPNGADGSSGPSQTATGGAALAAVDSLTVKGREPKTGYSREKFGTAWADTDPNGCDTRVISMLRGMIAGLSQLVEGVVRCAY